MSKEIIEAEGLTKMFNGHLTAVDHIDFSVKSGEIFGFLGPNGAGKTTSMCANIRGAGCNDRHSPLLEIPEQVRT